MIDNSVSNLDDELVVFWKKNVNELGKSKIFLPIIFFQNSLFFCANLCVDFTRVNSSIYSSEFMILLE